ncbi:metallophosphoesterase family protein [Alteromonas lipolytica]|uniref:Calcineurin-like phosphoesterase domain-containing protein n=1 Tax=Alteromonas lipolytica TaxID=1856405 RepID=A0A1E8FEX7_9ALTE|nr:metallophosphoesterase [Alteromonas lipolytica]OFI34485.1 hypothetical protein BFC17_17780 [Alteromonas lipolytica]GGF84961.1 3',5'-cyclic adenosine monophosphate phosphodiesterase CpdA [Alteromonas lipolytica]
MKLVQISDCHLFASAHTLGYGNINPALSLQSVLALALQQQPDGLLFTGDISGDDSAQSYQLFSDILTRCCPGVPWRVIPGNHDNNPYFDQALGANWLQAGQPWRLDGVMVHGLDTRYTGTQGIIVPHQLDAITKAIVSEPEINHVLAIHHHPVATNSWMDNHALHGVDALARWLTEQPVSLVLHGHIHADTQAELSATPILGVPSSSWQWQLSAEFGLAPSQAGLRLIESDENHRLSSRIIRIAAQ